MAALLGDISFLFGIIVAVVGAINDPRAEIHRTINGHKAINIKEVYHD